MKRLPGPIALLLAALAFVAILPSQGLASIVDRGSFKVYRGDRVLGAETFEYLDAADSLVLRARQYLTLPSPEGDQPFEKGADLLLGKQDLVLRQYQSNRKFHGEETIRALVIADTHYVAYRERKDAGGEGDSRVLPPGHLFVMDSQMVTLFDLMCRSLPAGAFPDRPINLLALGPRDTMLEAHAASIGNETIRWGGKPVVARKLQIVADSQTTFTLWVGPQGQLLRLSEPRGGLRAERDAPAIKRRTPAPPPPPKTPPKPTPGG